MIALHLIIPLLALLAVAHTQQLKYTLTVSAQPAEGCSLVVLNKEQLLDISTDCMISTEADADIDQGEYQRLSKFILAKAAYLIKKDSSRPIFGYRYFKDSLNYKYK
jgi:hypothetical protein